MLMVLLPLTAVLVIFVKNAWSYTAKEQPLTARNILMALITGMTIRPLRQPLRSRRRHHRHAALYIPVPL